MLWRRAASWLFFCCWRDSNAGIQPELRRRGASLLVVVGGDWFGSLMMARNFTSLVNGKWRIGSCLVDGKWAQAGSEARDARYGRVGWFKDNEGSSCPFITFNGIDRQRKRGGTTTLRKAEQMAFRESTIGLVQSQRSDRGRALGEREGEVRLQSGGLVQ
uniref:Uncharacterized protein n=1 Tax=Photinus pyralis TaxID=7054 RepID=A0A1Y1L913_PHOPY